MLHHKTQFAIVVILVAAHIAVGFGEGYAADLTIELIANPNETDIYLGADPIDLAVTATGKDLTYEWKLLGEGKLDAKGSSAIYYLPGRIKGESVQTVIIVTVTDQTGQEASKSMTFNILSDDQKPDRGGIGAAPLVLGLAAAGGIGAGVYFLLQEEEDEPDSNNTGCGGESFAGYCWYLGGFAQSCTAVCSSHGGYHEATKTFVGSHGSVTNCQSVLNTLNAPQPTYYGSVLTDSNSTAGCSVEIDGEEVIRWWGQLETDPDAGFNYLLRVCACNQ